MKLPKLDNKILAMGILGIAICFCIGSAIYKCNKKYRQTFMAGQPPQEILERIDPKKVPYNQIKPPAVSELDAFLVGSASSSIGVIFYGDYTDPKSTKLLREIEPRIRSGKGLIRLIWHNLPSSTENNDPGFEAAVLSECSRILDSSWNVHYALIALNKDKVKNADLNRVSTENQDPKKLLEACRFDSTVRANVKYTIDLAKGDGIDQAPFIFVGSQAIPSQNATSTSIIEAIQAYLK